MLRSIAIVAIASLLQFLPHHPVGHAQGAGTTATVHGIVDVDGGIAAIASPRDGIVQEIRVEEGDSVKKGDVLLVVDDRAAQVLRDVAVAEVQQAETTVGLTEVLIAAADREVRRLAPLTSNNVSSRQRFDAANDLAKTTRRQLANEHAAISSAKARLAAAEVEVDRRTIRAPFDGRVVRRFVQLGDGISILNVTTLLWLAPNTPAIVRANILEPVALTLTVGQPVEIMLDGKAGSFKGRIQRLGQLLGTRRYTVYGGEPPAPAGRFLETIVAFDSPPMRPVLGQRATVTIVMPADSQ